ncbi:TIGR04282 family arsenosugar biosynthesis glycosyltransferase [Cognatishimia sp. SS12]|uniref:TIGR04282 family arsenosugar biosynthesis glycosyltransferase n=1 Tax=Cognatishimia sp. SS12 TaxID=2979465 RepID=UPI0023304798|nr:TIGR04282 family arsenosugar biosynthesis glycosyltransferase [Cognatishimia sp. SS12]MDC0737622.1 TIGR04282 family arsenosugar biosynthesis glycosyltransferase [Cognatishimia sp. SS12]
MRATLVVMVKEPHPGRVKTRLGRDLGMTGAAWWFRHQVAAVLRRLQSPKWDLVLAVAPDHEGLQSRVWPAHLARIPQGAGDLGARMARIFRTLPPGPVCIIGADIPGITQQHIASAFAALGTQDAIFGPAPDGGYWLVGLKRARAVPAGLFEGVRWSTEHALSDSIATMKDLRIAKIATLRDVDTLSDLKTLTDLSR